MSEEDIAVSVETAVAKVEPVMEKLARFASPVPHIFPGRAESLGERQRGDDQGLQMLDTINTQYSRKKCRSYDGILTKCLLAFIIHVRNLYAQARRQNGSNTKI